jgi:hypothetical protein
MVQYIKIEITHPLTYHYTLGDYNHAKPEKINSFLSSLKDIPYNNDSNTALGAPKIEGDVSIDSFQLGYPTWASAIYGITLFVKDASNLDQFKCIMNKGIATISGTLFFKINLKDEAYLEMVNNIEYLFIDSFTPKIYLDGGYNKSIWFNKIVGDHKQSFDLIHKTWGIEKKIGPERKVKVSLAKKLKELM